jgi:hypothetical protein
MTHAKKHQDAAGALRDPTIQTADGTRQLPTLNGGSVKQ